MSNEQTLRDLAVHLERYGNLVTRVLVTGSRQWTDWLLPGRVAYHFHEACPKSPTLVNGRCRGADIIFRTLWLQRGGLVEDYLPDWSKGLGSGHTRNRLMVDSGVDICVSFNLGTPGTTGCQEYALSKGVPTFIFMGG